ncbi:UNVERIFIED_CONTAM: hypothetical protein ABIC26_001672 [Paenibacillus sp. PvR008]
MLHPYCFDSFDFPAVNKKELSQLIQQLPDKDVPLVADLIKRLINHPLDSHIPFDDEPLTDSDIQAMKNAKKEFNKGTSFKLKDFENELRN